MHSLAEEDNEAMLQHGDARLRLPSYFLGSICFHTMHTCMSTVTYNRTCSGGNQYHFNPCETYTRGRPASHIHHIHHTRTDNIHSEDSEDTHVLSVVEGLIDTIFAP